ncbi:hypothetical protein VCRA2121O391_400034 [Vibrio crassostreae]|nr:hypothetical protein VCRA2117O378_430015 [Vibrio crassostreae]CAK2312889.1 hypothetical protein VCRA2119O386_200015 [Vibrio crassostreae]CAK2335364.1 hypothetical protein VCRA2116O372_240080 [Vibrio crassostreae]CAK2429844.1 hypothetical protein VCRA2116O373_190088 [Vibrio crassostreae]CAK2447777.1 hypothetical protein VCRA2113O364_200015 [Vibrio crassostreae]
MFINFVMTSKVIYQGVFMTTYASSRISSDTQNQKNGSLDVANQMISP